MVAVLSTASMKLDHTTVGPADQKLSADGVSCEGIHHNIMHVYTIFLELPLHGVLCCCVFLCVCLPIF